MEFYFLANKMQILQFNIFGDHPNQLEPKSHLNMHEHQQISPANTVYYIYSPNIHIAKYKRMKE